MRIDLPTRFNPAEVETRIYAAWESRGLFHAEPSAGRPKFTLCIPPPNITGILTMGHVLDNMPQDILVRWHRMLGDVTAWIPGTDHAGIATQNVVERELKKQKIDRRTMGREAFVKRVWEWREQYGGRILEQLKRLGCSCDWPRIRFTMDENLSRAVTEAFCRLYDKGLIYQGDYIVNWCPKNITALSDEEVEHREVNGTMTWVKYPLVDGSGEITVATTRPETILGDTAVAVHPEDPRYKALIGKKARLPVLGREIPVVGDAAVDPKFGTGAVKVTPAHDPVDFEIGQRHNLRPIVVMDTEARMTAEAGPFKGLDRFECRKQLLERLKADGLFVKQEPHVHQVGHCQRCEAVIEPYLSKQWFVKMKPLAEPAIAAVKEGRIRFNPDRWTKVYLNWMENIRDWCISRQLWWGHRIPIWTCEACRAQGAYRTAPAACAKCKGTRLQQDPDVLDTWFSSWLWPFSTLGWPDENTPEMKYFYPTDVLNAGKDILFFWVARMIMAGFEFTGKAPFEDVYIHGIARDAQGRKLSKSLNNSPDPLELFGKYGTDAVRFGMIANIPIGSDISLTDDTYLFGRNFVTKLWNAGRFLLSNSEGFEWKEQGTTPGCPWGPLEIEDRWILNRLLEAIQDGTRHLRKFEFGEAGQRLYHFLWDDFCDWYVEFIKDRLAPAADAATRAAAQGVALHVFSRTLRLLHPFIPFVTEELWQNLRKLPGGDRVLSPDLITASWPDGSNVVLMLGHFVPGEGEMEPALYVRLRERLGHEHPLITAMLIPEKGGRPGEYHFDFPEEVIAVVQGVVAGIREVRNRYEIAPGVRMRATLIEDEEGFAGFLKGHRTGLEVFRRLVMNQAGLSHLTFARAEERPASASDFLVGSLKGFVHTEGLIDWEKEKKRWVQQKAKLREQIDGVQAKLANANFVKNAPEEVVAEARLLELKLNEKLAEIDRTLTELAKH